MLNTLTHEYRGDILDLSHQGYICVVNEKGDVIGNAGNPNAKVFFRSSSKPIQALPIIARGLHKKYNLTDEETTIFSGSHLGEDFHINALKSIFEKAGFSEDELIVKPTKPGSAFADAYRIKNDLPLRKFYHNCTGKHSALMLLQKELTGSANGYHKIESPAQQEILNCISVLSQYPKEDIEIGIDGCGVPVFAVPMQNMAISFKNLVRPNMIKDESLAKAALQYVPNINKYPHMMRGTDYLCSLINHDNNITAKGGANGVYCLALKNEGIGIAFKLKDGTEAVWPIIIKEIFKQIGYYNSETFNMLDKLNNGIIKNDNDTEVGHHQAVFKLSWYNFFYNICLNLTWGRCFYSTCKS